MVYPKVFLHSAEADADVKTNFRNKNYRLVALTDDPAIFWEAVESVAQSGYLALMSHGNADGPLMVSGHEGDDVDTDRLTRRLIDWAITFYCLSCETGSGAFAAALENANVVRWAAPKGFARVTSAPGGVVAVHSIDADGNPAEWAWSPALRPRLARSSRPLNIE